MLKKGEVYFLIDYVLSPHVPEDVKIVLSACGHVSRLVIAFTFAVYPARERKFVLENVRLQRRVDTCSSLI